MFASQDTDQAIVTLTHAVTRKRRDYWLGEYDSPASRERYYQVLATWEANGRRLPAPLEDERGSEAEVATTDVTHAYRRWVEGYYAKGKLYDIKAGIRLARKLFGHTPAKDFGPRKLRLVREQMIRGDETADPPRRPWARPYINQQCRYIRHMFKWAASHEMIPASVHEQLGTMEPLRRGRTQAREPAPVRPVANALVDAIKPYVSEQVWALIELQRLTGARGGELFTLRPVDLNIHGEVWTATLDDHKTARHGRQRTLYFGPQGQDRSNRGSSGKSMKDPP